jgi:hypothetical protein
MIATAQYDYNSRSSAIHPRTLPAMAAALAAEKAARLLLPFMACQFVIITVD